MIALIVEAALRSLVLAAVVWLAMAAIRPRNPHLHETVWITVVLASIAMPFLIAFSIAPEIPAPASVLAPGSALTLRLVATDMAGAPTPWVQGATALYALAACGLVLRFAIGLARTWRIWRRAEILREPWAASDRVRVSGALRSPATFGSTILLPAEYSAWSGQKLAAVMAHERSHVRRRDCYVLWIARLHACVFWINPLAWWMHRRLAELAETTSDDAAMAELGDRTAYAQVLLEIAAPLAKPLAVAAVEMSGSRLPVAARIERIISDIAPAAAPKRVYRIMAALLVLPAVVASAASLRAPAIATFARAEEANVAPNEQNPAEDDLAPKLISGDMELEKYYPPDAARNGIEGLVTIGIRIDADGLPTGTRILAEEPLDLGFGTQADALVRTFRFTNPRHQPAEIPMKVKFTLKGHGSPGLPLPPPPNPAGG
jgi:bla regulator protein blaR1